MITSSGKTMQIVVFRLGEQEYGLEIFKVQEIIRLPAITKLPNTADYVVGIINLRGSIVPVVDMKRKFLQSETIYSDDTKIIVTEVGSKKFGLIVDEVNEVLTVHDDMIETSDFGEGGFGAKQIMGIAKIEKRLLILLNIEETIN